MKLSISFKQTYEVEQQEVKEVVMVRKEIRKGCMKIKVGGEGEEQQKITVPVNYLKHPLFVQLLKEAEEEYGFTHKGTITIPCQLAQFKHVQHLIDAETSLHHHHHLHLVPCFRA
ncbi:auxin-responsive protein SAUR32-like [Vigna unguiculata]|uniref:SAUR family protein n=1 Tax=Vigna unguiculata TaxID=3917 RepID=A0A4D6KQW7_VIGUN|nr:auxin-responsive protein SAUR32-like [Vigna unguiculata]QCD77499.1 SAUR family protein [Vigna unguiculata]